MSRDIDMVSEGGFRSSFRGRMAGAASAENACDWIAMRVAGMDRAQHHQQEGRKSEHQQMYGKYAASTSVMTWSRVFWVRECDAGNEWLKIISKGAWNANDNDASTELIHVNLLCKVELSVAPMDSTLTLL